MADRRKDAQVNEPNTMVTAGISPGLLVEAIEQRANDLVDQFSFIPVDE